MNVGTQKLIPGCSVIAVTKGSIGDSNFLLVEFSSPDGEKFQLLIPEGCMEVEVGETEKETLFSSNSETEENSTDSSSDDEDFFLTYIEDD